VDATERNSLDEARLERVLAEAEADDDRSSDASESDDASVV
jgi:hypothetical protein